MEETMAKDFYRTEYGRAVLTRAEDYLPCLPDASVDLIMTSPPFALLRQRRTAISTRPSTSIGWSRSARKFAAC